MADEIASFKEGIGEVKEFVAAIRSNKKTLEEANTAKLTSLGFKKALWGITDGKFWENIEKYAGIGMQAEFQRGTISNADLNKRLEGKTEIDFEEAAKLIREQYGIYTNTLETSHHVVDWLRAVKAKVGYVPKDALIFFRAVRKMRWSIIKIRSALQNQLTVVEKDWNPAEFKREYKKEAVAITKMKRLIIRESLRLMRSLKLRKDVKAINKELAELGEAGKDYSTDRVFGVTLASLMAMVVLFLAYASSVPVPEATFQEITGRMVDNIKGFTAIGGGLTVSGIGVASVVKYLTNEKILYLRRMVKLKQISHA